MRVYPVIAFWQVSEIENYASNALFLSILCHICMGVEHHFGGQALALKQCARAVNGVLLDVHCHPLAVFAHKFAQKRGVIAAPGGCVNTHVTRAHDSLYCFVYNRQCIHNLLIPHSRALGNRVGDFDSHAIKCQIVDCGFLRRIAHDNLGRICNRRKTRCAEIDIALCKFDAFKIRTFCKRLNAHTLSVAADDNLFDADAIFESIIENVTAKHRDFLQGHGGRSVCLPPKFFRSLRF